MQSLKIGIFIALFVYPDTVGAFTEKQAEVCLELARRQVEMYEAKMKNDWQKMYSLLTPDLRKKVSLSRFITSPHHLEEPKKISGAITYLPATEKKIYLPLHLGYRFRDFYLSNEGKKAKIVSRVAIPNFTLQFENVLYIMDDEYWIKTEGKWYSQLDMKIIAHLSGATTEVKSKVSFKNALHITAAELARYFAEKAATLPSGAQRNGMIQSALLAEAFTAIEVFGKNKTSAGNLPDAYVRRQIAGHPTSVFYFSLLIKAARWFATAGNYKSSYEYYLKAHQKDVLREDALAGAAVAAIKLGSFEDGVKHYIEYLKIISILRERQPETLEPYIKDGCSICPEISFDTKIELARQLVGSQKWEQAVAVYKNILESRPQWHGILKKLKSGVFVKPDAAGERIAEELRNLTSFEIQKMLQTAGYGFLHSSDFPQGDGNIKGEIFLESIPKMARRHYDPNYMLNFMPARAAIQIAGKKFSYSSYYSAGYVAVLLEEGKPVRGGFYIDNIGRSAGSSKLIDEIKKLQPGARIFLARISIKPDRLDGEWLETLTSIGVEAGALQKEITGYLVSGIKQSPPGSARTWNGFYAIRKILLKSSTDEIEKLPGPALIISGNGVRLF